MGAANPGEWLQGGVGETVVSRARLPLSPGSATPPLLDCGLFDCGFLSCEMGVRGVTTSWGCRDAQLS